MRVILITPYPPLRDGIGAYSKLIRDELVAQGHQTAIVNTHWSGSDPSEVIATLGNTSQSRDHVLERIGAFAPDVVHVQFAVAAYAIGLRSLIILLRRLKRDGYAVVVTAHEVTRDTDSLRSIGRYLYRKICVRADGLIVHTDPARERLASLLEGESPPLAVLSHPRAELPRTNVRPEDLRERFALGDATIILAFGFIDVDKGLRDLVKAVPMIVGAESCLFVFAGAVRRRFGLFRLFEARDRIYERLIRRDAESSAAADRLRFAGYVPDDSVRAWFDVAALVVLPYRRSEESGVASLALAADAPLLTTAVGQLGENSCVPPVRPGRPAELAAAISAFLGSSASSRPELKRSPDLAAVVRTTVSIYVEAAQGAQLSQ